MASVPYEFECDKNGGFLPDPNEHKRVGYVTALSGFSTSGSIVFDPDLQVFSPWNGAALGYKGPIALEKAINNLYKTNVVGVIEKFSWNGGVGDFIQCDMWVSQENAVKLKTAQQSTLTTTRVDSFSWWIINFDQEKKIWYEQSYPLEPAIITGIVGPQDNPELNVDLTGAPAKDGIDVMVYKVSIQIACGANQQFFLMFANTAGNNSTKAWGLQVGTWAAASY
jgi:hypothetical protein